MAVRKNQMLTGGECISCSSDIAVHIKNRTAVITGIACTTDEITQAETAVNSLPNIERVFNLVTTEFD